MTTRGCWPARLVASTGVVFLALTGLVALGLTRVPDVDVLAATRPDDVWGPTQVRYSPWMHWLSPDHLLVALGAVTAVATVVRRSWRPLASGLALGLCTVALVTAVKLALGRPDPHGAVPGTGGSYPSGHMATLVVCLLGCLLVLAPRIRWWHWVPVTVGATVLGAAQLVSAAHWPSDLLGGVLLGLVVVGVTRVVDPGGRSRTVGSGGTVRRGSGRHDLQHR